MQLKCLLVNKMRAKVLPVCLRACFFHYRDDIADRDNFGKDKQDLTFFKDEHERSLDPK